MFVKNVLSGSKSPIAGFGYDKTWCVLRIVIKPKKQGEPCDAYDYYGVTPEDAGIFAQGFGKSLEYIKEKYGHTVKKVKEPVYRIEY